MTAPLTITAPSSKSLSHRALICSALADGISQVRRVLDSDDLRITRACLTAGGVSFDVSEDLMVVRGLPTGLRGGTPEAPADLYMKESGTSCRLLTAVASAGEGAFKVHGADRLHERPIGELARALHGQGVDIAWLQETGCPPLLIQTHGLDGGVVSISLEESSQYLSGLLLAAPLARRATTIEVTGTKAVSWPYVGLTLAVMDVFGVKVQVQTRGDGAGAPWRDADWRRMTSVTPGRVRFLIQPGRYAQANYAVEGDYSSASYFLGAGALAGPITVAGISPDSAQGDRAMLDILAAMGARLDWNGTGDAVTVQGPEMGNLHGVEVDMGLCPDLVPTVCVVAAQAEGPTTIRNVAHLRIKESDRLAAMATELARAGAKTELLDDGIIVTPAPLTTGAPIDFQTYGDHRVAMSLSLLELAGVQVRLDNPGCVAKSFPSFWQSWEQVRQARGIGAAS